ncbi:hypothetical protein QQX98_001008 [Neonectria punicea]|uniref:DUF6604 domain-containing protein n=1 Tax=Neonectria punicea TaxID=979145 RepID=A0ABR1HQP4_9HYPO
MLPKSLVSVYQDYKKDTNSVASWLATTAKACGYPLDLLSKEPPKPKTSGRLKGKARTGGKAKGKAPAKPAPKTVSAHIIAIKDFVPLAECIAGSKDVVQIPYAFDRALTRVIAVRASFGAKLSKLGAMPDAESDSKHSHFVGVLEKVRGLLQPLVSTTAAASTAAASTDPVETLNKFSGLAVHEPSEVFLDAPDIERPEKTVQEKVVYEAEPPQSLEDALVAFEMMLDDLKNIRDFISNIWSDLSDETNGQFIDPAAVAIATNTGIDFARNLIDGMLPVFEDHGGIFEMCQQYFTSVLDREGFSPEDVVIGVHEEQKHEFYDLGSACYFNAGVIINALADAPLQSHVPIYGDNEFGVYDPESDRGGMTVQEKVMQDHLLLTELFMEALTIVHHVPDYPIVDEFIRGVKEFHETRKVPFFLIFAAQITLDILYVVRDHAETAVTTLFKRLKKMKFILEENIEFHENLKRPRWSSHNEKALKSSLQRFMEDPLHKAKARIKGRRLMQSIRKHRLLRRSPIVTGLALYHFRAAMYDIGIALTNVWATLTLPAHLYNAARVRGSTSCVWYDMELLIQKYGEEQFFVGGRPTNPADCLTRFLLQTGVSASAFANRGREPLGSMPNVSKLSRAGPRLLKHGATVSRIFQDRYGRNSGAINWTPESIKEILGRSQVGKREVDGVTLAGRTGTSPKPQQRRTAHRANPRHKRTEVADDRRFSAGELLSSLVLAMQAEVAEFAFPYLLMHMLTWRMLGIIDRQSGDLSVNFGPEYLLASEWELPFKLCNFLYLDRPEDCNVWRLVGMAFDEFDAIKVSSAAIRGLGDLSGLKLEIPGYFGIEDVVSEGSDEKDKEDHEHYEDEKDGEDEEKN